VDLSRIGRIALAESIAMHLRTSKKRSKGKQGAERRPGFSLVEMLVSVVLASLLLGLAISFIHALLLADRKLRDRPAALDQCARLADELRADIRRAFDVTQPDEKRLVIQFSATERAEYELTPHGCQRRSARAESSGARADLFAIGNGLTWQIQRRPAARNLLVTVWLQSSGQSAGGASLPPIWIVAALGADRGGNASKD
jgi:prepilin-type N-terminal cleavage/methylation domain-containing protein